MDDRHPSALLDTSRAQRRVAPLMVIALAALLTGLWAGLARLGWQLPDASSALMLRHGGLMVIGFVGTVIAVERAVAVRSLPAYAAPLFSAACGVSLIIGAPFPLSPALAAVAGVAYTVNIGTLVIRHRTLPFEVMLVGAVCLPVAAVAWWHGGGLATVVPWWIAFLALTIGAERLELLRFQRFGRRTALIGLGVLALIALGPAIALVEREVGVRVQGVGLLAGAAWLASRDHARRGIRADGLARFIAVGLLLAYAWVAVTGLLLIAWGLSSAGWQYDAVIHAFFIGVVFSAIIAHEPIIAPSVTGLRFAYSPLLYVPLALLDAALVVRIGSDIVESASLRRWTGLVQAIAIVLLLVVTVRSVILARHEDAPSGD